MAIVFDKIEDSPVNKTSYFTGKEISLSSWQRSLCESIDYPAFNSPDPIILPDMLTEQLLDFTGYACYETVFVLDSPKTLLLEITNTSGSVEVFLNGETAGMKLKPPFRYDLSDLVWQGKNYLAIEVAVFTKKDCMADAARLPGKTQHCKHIIQNPYIIGSVRLYTN
jgi:hypothetical protein